MKFRQIVVFLLLSSLFLNSVLVSFAQEAKSNVLLLNGITFVNSIEGIKEYRLANGMQILLFPDPTKQNITVNIIYRVGSRHESYGETGMAHLLEHLVFKGTPKHPNIPAELTVHGASPNGTTWYDRTNYHETFAASDENLDWALDLEADRMINSYIAKKDLASEFSVVRNEMELGENDPSSILMEKMMATAYQWHNYGKDTIGAKSDVENVKIENLQAFYRKYYQPDNATLVVAGKIDEAKTLDLISKKFGGIPKPTRILEPTWTIEPVQDGERQVTLRRVGSSKYVMSGYHVPPSAHPDFPAVMIMTGILTDPLSGKLYKSLVESKKAIGTYNFTYQTKEPGYSIFAAELSKDGSIDAVRDAMLNAIENFADTTPSKEEVERYKLAELKNIEMAFNEPNTVALMITDWVARGDWRLLFLYRERIKKVTPEDVRRVAKSYLIQSNRTLGIFVPTEKPVRAEVPRLDDKQILAMANEVQKGEAVARGEVFEATLANIESHLKLEQIGNIKTAYLSKENRGDAVTVNIAFQFGNVESLMNIGKIVGNITGFMLMRGTTKHTRQQINDEFNRLKAQVTINGATEGVNISIRTTRQNLTPVLKLAAEILKEPTFPQKDFDLMKTRWITSLENERNDPNSVAGNEMNIAFNKYPKGDIRYLGTLDESIAEAKAISLDAIKKFHKDFYGASSGQIVAIGDFDEKEMTFLLTQLFGNWKSSSLYERIPNQYFDIPAFNKSYETPDKANAVFLARMNVKMRDDNPDYPALTLGNFILGGGFLNSRLATRIRQKEGLSYQILSSFYADSLDETGEFRARAISAPQNINKLETAFKEELQKILTEGITVQELEEAKKGWILDRQRNLGNDFSIAVFLRRNLFLNRNLSWDEELDKKVQALTVDNVNTALKKHLSLNKISFIKAGAFAKAKEATP